uniref:Protein quiver n=1 Tax=Panagrolaimus sp. PS1159 TaxID=55785 RepID=A0AC35GU95_9BILA
MKLKGHFCIIFFTLSIFINSVLTINCHLCDSCENSNIVCEGSACITRKANIDGKVRIQKMCEISGKNLPNPQIPECYETFLWQGIKGTECICYSDWCNATSSASIGTLLSSPKIIVIFSFFIFAVVQRQ